VTYGIEPPSILISIWLIATGFVDEDDIDGDEITAMRADRLKAIARLIRDHVHPSHWPAFEARARQLEKELQEWADRHLGFG
jgi:hypothetical protein